MTSSDSAARPGQRPRVLIVGGGVAGLEAAFALQEMAGDHFQTTIMAPTDEFVLRPLAVGEPFTSAWARRYRLDDLAAQAGAELMRESLAWVDAKLGLAHTGSGAAVGFDALLFAVGARVQSAYAHTTTVDPDRMDDALHGLVNDIEGGYVGDLAIIVPAPMPWPLPAYELALMCSERAWDMQTQLAVTLFTPEERPLALFGTATSEALSELLAERDVRVVSGAYCEVPRARAIIVHPGGRLFTAERIMALPALYGPHVPGLPQDGGGFVPVDEFGRVRGVENVWAAGDATDFAIKHGGIAAQLADTAAQSIAAQFGVCPPPEPFAPVLEGVLLTGGTPRYMRARPTGGHGADPELTRVPRGEHPPKVAAKYLVPHLTKADSTTVSPST
ncbi:MAG TPA: hypothetical protein VF781_01925 [Solirubrobacteraceae bacterium]